MPKLSFQLPWSYNFLSHESNDTDDKDNNIGGQNQNPYLKGFYWHILVPLLAFTGIYWHLLVPLLAYTGSFTGIYWHILAYTGSFDAKRTRSYEFLIGDLLHSISHNSKDGKN